MYKTYIFNCVKASACRASPSLLTNRNTPRWRNYLCLHAAGTYGLLHFDDFCLWFPSASGKFARGILLGCETLHSNRLKAVYCKLKEHYLKQ